MTDPYEGQKNPVLAFAKKRWLGVLIAVLALIFVIQNGLISTSVTVYLFFWTLTWPSWLLMASVFFAGWLVGWLISRRNTSAKK